MKLETIDRDVQGLRVVGRELAAARNLHVVPLNSPHEAFAVIAEELDEFWDEVRAKKEARSKERMRKELAQVGAMCVRAITDLNLFDDPSDPRTKGNIEAAHHAQAGGRSPRRRFTIEMIPDFSLLLDINLVYMPPGFCAEVNSYWDDGESLLRHAGGDAVRAIALRAAAFLLPHLLLHADPLRALDALAAETGWPSNHGISIHSFELPSLSPTHLTIIEESR